MGLESTAEMLAGRMDAAAECHAEWYKLAAQEWNYVLTGVVPHKAAKTPRDKAYKWLLAVDSMLQNYGLDLARFLLDPDPARRPAAQHWPVLTISLDQGSTSRSHTSRQLA